MFVSIYYKPSLFNAHTMILIFHIFMNVNKLCLNQEKRKEKKVNKEMKDEESEGMSAEKVDKVAFCLSLFITVSVHVLFLCLLA